jgi:hypothetical protein
MPRATLLLLSAGVATAAALSPARADELWRQDHADCTANPSHCYGGPASQDARNPGGPGWMFEVVDNFDAAAGATITRLEFWGGQATTTPAVTDGFMIRFYADNNGQVGPLIRTQDVFTFTQEVYFTWPLLPLQGFHYTLNLVQPLTIAATGRYWIGIVAIQPYGGPNDRQWGWNLSDSVHPPYCQQATDPPSTYSPQTYDVAFVLFGDPPPSTCYANCDRSWVVPILNVNDFVCFQARFAAADPYADCDQSGTLNVNDFVCFQARFAAGCSGF